MISKIINWVKVPTLSGLALSKFYRKRYNDAVPLFEKLCRIDPKNKKIEYINACLGRCYLSIKKYDEALLTLENAYNLYSKRSQPIQDDFERKEYIELLNAYIVVLRHFGNNDLAIKIDEQVKENKYPGEIQPER